MGFRHTLKERRPSKAFWLLPRTSHYLKGGVISGTSVAGGIVMMSTFRKNQEHFKKGSSNILSPLSYM